MEENTRESSRLLDRFNKCFLCFLLASIVAWLFCAAAAACAHLNEITLNYDLFGFLFSMPLGLIFELISIINNLNNKWKKALSGFAVILAVAAFSIALLSLAIIAQDWKLQENSTVQQEIEVEDSSNADNSLSVRSSCIPSDTLTAIFTDMNATIEVETNFEAARVTAQSVVDGVADDVIELSQTGTYSWSAKVRFEVAGTHNIEICVYLDNGECVTDVLTVEYPFA